MMDKEEIRKNNPGLYKIAIEGGTEAPFSGKFLKENADGVYTCAVCDNPLFSSENKFDSGTGWPSFDRPISKEAVQYRDDIGFGMSRVEVLCKKCGAHLGHVFDDGPEKTTGKRYCINSVCLDLEKKISSLNCLWLVFPAFVPSWDAGPLLGQELFG